MLSPPLSQNEDPMNKGLKQGKRNQQSVPTGMFFNAHFLNNLQNVPLVLLQNWIVKFMLPL